MNDLEKELSTELDKSLTEAPPFPRAVPNRPASLTDQWAKLRSIDDELRKRVRQEKLLIEAQFDKLMIEIKNDFDMRVEVAVTAIEADKQKAIRVLIDQTSEKLREHELLARRMNL